MSTAFPISIVSDDIQQVDLSVFATAFGFFGLLGTAGRLLGVRIGHRHADDVAHSFQDEYQFLPEDVSLKDWHPALRQRLQVYCQGQCDDFRDIEIVYRKPLTPFRKSVLNATRRIPPGQRLTYLELATNAGSPGAARAAGNTMATNLFPIIVPCHRVVGSSGKLGGFTAPGGLDLKRQLLELEQPSHWQSFNSSTSAARGH